MILNLQKKGTEAPFFFVSRSCDYKTTSCFVADNPFGPLTVMM
jgi:hypothetical protein